MTLKEQQEALEELKLQKKAMDIEFAAKYGELKREEIKRTNLLNEKIKQIKGMTNSYEMADIQPVKLYQGDGPGKSVAAYAVRVKTPARNRTGVNYRWYPICEGKDMASLREQLTKVIGALQQLCDNELSE